MHSDDITPKKTKSAYFNRELSWLAFNRRVLEQAYDDRFPILDRMRFLSFVASNLDEFFEIRVAGLMQQTEGNVSEAGPDGLGPKELLRRIHSISASLVNDQYECWHEQIVPALTKAGVLFKSRDKFTRREIAWMEKYFEDEVFPVLTPLAIDPAHPFPSFGNKSLNLLLSLDDPDTPEVESILAFIPVPRILPRVVFIPGANRARPCYVFLSDLIKLFADRLFIGYKVSSIHAFRITRNSDLYIDEEEVENLLKTIEEELYKRRKGSPVRLEIEEGVNDKLLDRLLSGIGLSRQHVFLINGPINLMRLQSVYDLIDRPDLKCRPFNPYVPPSFSGSYNIYDVIREHDRILHHPYDSFQPVVDFVAQAALDPKVLAIKMTLYRTSSDSPIVKALIAAAHNGKQVTALIELKARFDEENNINWARQLEDAGVHVVYGFVKLKTHCKLCLVVRKEKDGIRRYSHLGTGNYHSKTARLYTDLSFFTCRKDITNEVAEVFNTLTGFAKNPHFNRLLVAPFNLHNRIVELILREAENARAGKPARIIVKCNSLIDKEAIDALYEASRAGVQIDLVIRGICGLVPGILNMSDTIRVRSILGRYLEHSRIFYFENAGKPELYLGSADLMPRNFYRRVEVVFPIEDEAVRTRIVNEVLKYTLADTTAKELHPNGSYGPSRKEGEKLFASQDYFMKLSDKRAKADAKADKESAKNIDLSSQTPSLELVHDPKKNLVKEENLDDAGLS
jgi:polyphosphate kinase